MNTSNAKSGIYRLNIKKKKGTLLFRFQILPFFDFYEKSVNISFYLIYVIVDDILGYFSIGKGSKCNKNCGKCVRIDKANARNLNFCTLWYRNVYTHYQCFSKFQIL